MADGSKKDIKITAGIEGVEDVGKGADKALTPWEKKAQAAGAAIKSAFTGAFQDITRVLTVGNAISFAQAIDSARKFREDVGRLSATAGPVGQLRAQIDAIGNAKLLRASEIIDADRGLGRIVYSAKNAMGAIGGLQDEALATGETLQQKLPLGAALMNGLGVAGNKVAGELGRVRDLADSLGTSGGLLAAEDRLTNMAGLLEEIGAKTDSDRAKLEALALGLGKGLGAQAGARAAGGILGALSGNREQFAALAGMKITALTNDDGSLNVDAAAKALPRIQQWIRRQSKDRGMQQMIATGLVGGDRQAGAALLNGDVTAILAAAGNAKDTGKTAGEAAAFRGSEAGQAIGRQIAMERNARNTAESLLPVADAAQGYLANHPLAGTMALGVGGNLAGAGIGGALSAMGKELMGGGRAVSAGGAEAERAMAAGGEKAAAALTAGSAAAKLGLIAGAGFIGYHVGQIIDEKLGISDDIAGNSKEQWKERTAEDNAAAEAQVKASREKRKTTAKRLVAAIRAGQEGNYDSKDAVGQILQETGTDKDVAMQRLVSGVPKGSVDVTGLSPESAAMIVEAIKTGFSNVKIENHSESPVTVNSAQSTGTLKN